MIEIAGILPPLASALAKRGYTELTPVQQAVLDNESQGADALVSAQTGSGKTVAFGLALAPTLLGTKERFGRPGAPLALVIAPTRELALQVRREFEWLYELTGATIASCVGGMDVRSERRALERGAHIIVGTPGRLRDHITRQALDLSEIRAVVLDEADEMLDLGFREDLEFILDASPDDRRTLMFSATVPKSIAKLAESYQRDAIRISTQTEKKQHVDIEYRALVVSPSDRDNAIVNVLRYYEAPNAIVFCNTRAAVNHLTARLNNRGFTVVALSGELSQSERTHALQAMRDGRARVCIATDVAARGIDLPNLELVVHADLPSNPDTLLHRSGRTGRAGRKGVSAVIIPTSTRRKAERVLQAAQITATWASPPSADEVSERDDERLLNHEAFGEPVRDDERAFLEKLIEKHGAELLAAAFVRQYREAHSAPEDLIEIGDIHQGNRPARGERPFADAAPRDRGQPFGPSRWISLSVGRKQNAEPRWLIPLLCRTGDITKREIGQIKMMQDETYIELSEESIDAFLNKVGPNKVIDKGIRVVALNGMPDFSAQNRAAPKKFADKKPWTDRKSDRGDFAGDRPARASTPRGEPRSDDAAKPKRKFARKEEFVAADRAYDDKPPRNFSKPAKPGKREAPAKFDDKPRKKPKKSNG